MGFNLEDRLRELEREVAELRQQQGRLPTRQASGQLRASVIRASVKGASSSATFVVDGVVLVTGVDPRDDPESATEEVTVANPVGLDWEDDQAVYCVWNEDLAQWEPFTAAGGEPGPPGDDGTSTLFCDFTATADSDATTLVITADIDEYWGGTPGSTSGVAIYKLPDHDLTFFSGQKGRAVWDPDALESAGAWKLLWFSGLFLTVKGTIAGTAVTGSTGTFTLASPTLVNGWRLPGSITVTNDPPIRAEIGETVRARFNLTVGSDPSTNWDTGDAGNFSQHLRGLPYYNAGGSQQQIINDEGEDDPHWGTVSVPDGLAFGILTSSIAASTPSTSGYTPTKVTGGIALLTYSGGAFSSPGGTDTVNGTAMPIESGVFVGGVIVDGEFIILWTDFRNGIPGFSLGTAQIMGHPADEELQHEDTGECD